MKHLTSLDAAFLQVESAETPMHVGSLMTLELPEGYAGSYYEDVKIHLSKRLHLAPAFERKLAVPPLGLANPVWVDAGEVDLDYHVRRVEMPRPGRQSQLETYVGHLHAKRLDRNHPLWEIYVFEGLEGGRVAIYSKFHHAGIDGAAGVALAKALLDVTPEPREVPPRDETRRPSRPKPGAVALAGDAVGYMASKYVKLIRLLPDAAKAVAKVALPSPDEQAERGEQPSRNLPSGWDFAPWTPFNVPVSSERAFASATMPLADVKAIATASGATINDVVMALCSTALRGYLYALDLVPEKSLVALVPVSLRAAGDTRQNNQVTFSLMSLATDVDDQFERLRAIRASSASVKQTTGRVKSAIPLDLPFPGAPWLVSGLATLYSLGSRAVGLPPIANVLVSNVPGPQTTLYYAGAKIVRYFPVSIPFHGVALNITVQSYDEWLEWGLTACRKAVPDVRLVADLLGEAFEELKSRASSGETLGTGAHKTSSSR